MTDNERNYILGAFVNAQRIRNKKLHEWTLVKLSSITVLNGVESDSEEGETIFNTYKDCSYWIPIHVFSLRAAVNCFIFTPEKHWELFFD